MNEILLLCCVVAVLCPGSADWTSYKSFERKDYGPEEDLERIKIYEANVELINEQNHRYELGSSSFRTEINQFTDLTNEEFSHHKGYDSSQYNDSRLLTKFDDRHIKRVPKTVDWRLKGYVTAVKDQGSCASSWAFSATGSLEGQCFKITERLVPLSEQNLIDCSGSEGSQGCSKGKMSQAFNYIRRNGGINTDSCYPYGQIAGQCHFRRNIRSIGAKIKGYVSLASGDESALQKAVATVGPISVAVDASRPGFRHYSSGIYDEPDCSQTELDHAVLLVGYGSENGTDFWIIKNSWGTDWGEDGYMRIARNNGNQCGIATTPSYPIVQQAIELPLYKNEYIKEQYLRLKTMNFR